MWNVPRRTSFSWYQVWEHLRPIRFNQRCHIYVFTSCSINIWSLVMGFSCKWALGKWWSHETGRSPVQVNTLSVFEFRALFFTGGVGKIRKISFVFPPSPHPTFPLWELWMCLPCESMSIHTWQQFLAWHWGMHPFLMIPLRVLSWILWQAQYCGTAVSYFHTLCHTCWTSWSILNSWIIWFFFLLASHQGKDNGQ